MPTRRVILVRHAERADEAPLEDIGSVPWSRTTRLYDPPLTRRGEEQARIAAKYIGDMFKVHSGETGLYDFSAVHTSQLLRCTQTAAAVSRELGGVPLRVNAGLASCAKWCRIAAALGREVKLASVTELAEAVADIEIEVARYVRPSPRHACRKFVETLEDLARQQRDNGALLVVTHREGIRQLDRIAGEVRKMAMPYCVVHEYEFDLVSGSWTLLDDSVIAKPVPCTRPKNRTFAFHALR